MVRFLSLDEVVANAMSIIPGAKKEMRPYFDQWAWLALRQIGPTKEHVNVATLTLEDLSFKKPDDFVAAIDIALFDSSNNEIKYHLRSGKQRIHERPLVPRYIEVSDSEHYYY